MHVHYKSKYRMEIVPVEQSILIQVICDKLDIMLNNNQETKGVGFVV